METHLQGVSITVSPPDSISRSFDAIVEEQDTALVLDIEPVIRQPEENYSALVDEMIEQQPLIPGDVIVRTGRPLRFLAVIHDLDQDPSCNAGSIAVALENLLRKLTEYRVHSVAMPLLGTVHGRFDDEIFMTLLYNAMLNEPLQYTEHLWLITAAENCERILRHIHKGR
ncbi:MAG: macro domain-containing protein [Gammaproteobacteria bacterium]